MGTALQWLVAQISGLGFQFMLAMFLLGGIFEFLIPAIAAPARHYVFNLTYAVINTLLTALIAPIPALGMAMLIQSTGAGLFDLSALGFGGIGGAIAAMLVGTVIFDFFYYWLHRTQHGSAILWQEHLLHHSDEHVNVTTSGRTHILEQFLFPMFISIPTALLFKLPPVTIVTISLIPTFWAYFLHTNARISFGRWWWLLASPQYHRIHHSIEPKHIDKNFTVYLPLWDILFGTAYRPKLNEYPKTGVPGVRVSTITGAYLLPFRGWLEMWRSRARIAS